MPEHLSFEEHSGRWPSASWRRNGLLPPTSDAAETIGYALSDSPAGHAMWIYEKFYSWTDNNGSPKTRCRGIKCSTTFHSTGSQIPRHRRTDLWENKAVIFRRQAQLACRGNRLPREIYRAPKSWASNLFESHLLERGSARGHFAAFEQRTFLSKKCVLGFEN